MTESLEEAIAKYKIELARSGGIARRDKLSLKRIRQIASIASKARWKKYRANHK